MKVSDSCKIQVITSFLPKIQPSYRNRHGNFPMPVLVFLLKSYLVSIHKWSFFRWNAFCAGNRHSARRIGHSVQTKTRIFLFLSAMRLALCYSVSLTTNPCVLRRTQRKKSSFMNWTLPSAIHYSWMDTIQPEAINCQVQIQSSEQ